MQVAIKTMARELSSKNRQMAWIDQADDEVAIRLGTIPARWGRMTPLGRALLLESAYLLEEKKLWRNGGKVSDDGVSAGLIGAGRYGSLQTDLDFQDTVAGGLASPALFGYTLPNIPLAEVATHFGLTGPVYALLEGKEPLNAAVREAQALLETDSRLSFMLACSFDYYPAGPNGLALTLTVVKRDV